MASTKVPLLQLLLVSVLSVVSGMSDQHFGMSSTYTYKGKNSDDKHTVLIRTRVSSARCLGLSTWKCNYGYCGTSTTRKNQQTFIGRTGPKDQRTFCESETVVLRTVMDNGPFSMSTGKCCWVKSRTGSPPWKASMLANLGQRSDTGEQNRSPVISILPFIRVPRNCPRTYNLTVFDPDGDYVRCRYATLEKDEEPAGFHLDEDTCTLHYTSAKIGLERFDMVVEDTAVQEYITVKYSDGSLPLRRKKFTFSGLPLQFSLQVVGGVPRCDEGYYIPKFVDPTPEDGAMIYADIGKEVVITVKAENAYAFILGLIFSGPLGSSSRKSGRNEFVIVWKPVADEVGEYVSICFAVETGEGKDIYQSVMRCVVVKVMTPKVAPNSHVICSESSMTIVAEKATLPPLNVDHLQLNDPSNTDCSVTSNETHIIAVTHLSQCGTQITEDDDNLFFSNEISTTEGTNHMITRKNLLELEFTCKYPKRGNVSQSFSVHRKNVTVFEKGMGTFTYVFEFYEDDTYQVKIDPDSYPLEVKIGKRLFMKIEATSSLNNTELFVESCRASPYDNSNYQKTYSIIEDGCIVDPTVNIYELSGKNQFKFSMEAFKFIGTFEQVYISCSVLMCEAGNPNTRASQGCIKPQLKPVRGKREAAIQSGRHSISQGPLRLKRSAENSASSAITLNLVFIAGCVLAAAGMILGVVMYKAKVSKI